MKVFGRKTGKVHLAPVNYAIHKGNIYCISGGRKESDWFRNLLANPEVELILPGGCIYANMAEVTAADEKLLVARQVLKNAGFAGFFEGYNPLSITDIELAEKTADLPVLRFHPLGLGSGSSDAGGWAWIWAFVITLLLIVLVMR